MDFALPEIGEGVYEAELVSWLVKPGDAIKRGQNLAEVLTDKATMEVPSPFIGTVTALLARPGQMVKVGDVLLSYTGAQQPAAVAAPAAAPAAGSASPAAAAPDGRHNGPAIAETPGRLPVKAAPSVRYLARKLGIDLTAVRGSGPQGRILIEDLTPLVRSPADHEAEPGASKRPPADPRPDYGRPGTRIKLQGLRRKIAEHMAL